MREKNNFFLISNDLDNNAIESFHLQKNTLAFCKSVF